MPSFRFHAFTASGKPDAGLIEASDAGAALRLLAARGVTVTSLEAKRAAAPLRRRRKSKLSADDLVALLREWATLLSAGLTVDESLAICGAEGKSPRVSAAIAELRRYVRDGKPLHDALNEIGLLPREAIVLVEAGEAAGALPKVLERLADDFGQSRTSQEGIITALLYPAVLLLTTFAAIAMIVYIVAPNLAELFDGSGNGAPPAKIAALLAFAAFIRLAGPIGCVVMVLVVAAFLLLRRLDGFRRLLDSLALRLPFFGGIIRSRDCARFSQAGALMIQCGVIPTKALPLAASSISNAALREALLAALASVAQGTPLTKALAKARALPPDLLALIDAGMRTGRLGEVLKHAGILHAARATSRIQRFSALLTPAITVFAGIVVGSLAYLVLSAVVSLNEVAFQ